MTQPKLNSQKPITEGEARTLITQMLFQLGNQGNTPIGPGSSVARQVPTFVGTDGRTLGNSMVYIDGPGDIYPVGAGQTNGQNDKPWTSVFSGNFIAPNTDATLESTNTNGNAKVNANTGGQVKLQVDGFDILQALVGFLNFQGNAIQNVILPVYANNAAAITGGLGVGDFYRTGANPDFVAVVH